MEKIRDKFFGGERSASRVDADKGNEHVVWKSTVFINVNVVTNDGEYLPMVGSTKKYSRGGVWETKSVRSRRRRRCKPRARTQNRIKTVREFRGKYKQNRNNCLKKSFDFDTLTV